jgi:hypothetical protein
MILFETAAFALALSCRAIPHVGRLLLGVKLPSQ